MIRISVMVILFLGLTACTTTAIVEPRPVKSSSKCNIGGTFNWKHSHPTLKAGLCKLSKRYGHVTVTSSCRTTKSNRGAKNSMHLYKNGCRAADVRIKGVGGSEILKWWGKNIGGGRGSYSCRNFVHVDTGPNRTWRWNFC